MEMKGGTIYNRKGKKKMIRKCKNPLKTVIEEVKCE